MTPEQFTYWLQGYLEVEDPKVINERKVQIIKDHLNLVFKKVTPDRKQYELLDTKFTGISTQPLCGMEQVDEIHDRYC